MTGLSLLLITAAALILTATLRLIYQNERQRWPRHWRMDGGREQAVTSPTPAAASMLSSHRRPAAAAGDDVDLLGADVAERTRKRLVSSDVFRYTIRRPTATTRKTMPDLGGFSEVPLRLYDQLGNRFTVHQKVRLN